MSVTLGYLRYRVGRKLGDMMKVVATTDGTTTKITDTIRLTGAPSVYAGRSLYCSNAADVSNVGLWREVTDSVNGVLTVSPGFTVDVTKGDTFLLSNERDRGFSPEEIVEAINDALTDAATYLLVPVSEDITATFDQTTGLIDVPLTLREVTRVYWTDSQGNLRDTYRAPSLESDGWTVLPGRRIQVNGPLRTTMDGMSVTLAGYGPPPALDDDSDTTEVPTDWLEAQALANLMIQGIDRNPERERRATFFAGLADRLHPTLFMARDANSVAVLP